MQLHKTTLVWFLKLCRLCTKMYSPTPLKTHTHRHTQDCVYASLRLVKINTVWQQQRHLLTDNDEIHFSESAVNDKKKKKS